MNYPRRSAKTMFLFALALPVASCLCQSATDQVAAPSLVAVIHSSDLETVLGEILNSSGERANALLKAANQAELPKYIVARLKAENDPGKRESLTFLVGNCQSPEAIRSLVDQLSDTRDTGTKCPECIGRLLRVSDVAFNILVVKLAKARLLDEANIIRSSKLQSADRAPANVSLNDFCEGWACGIFMRDPYTARDQAIEALRSYYQTNTTKILEKLAKPASSNEISGTSNHPGKSEP